MTDRQTLLSEYARNGSETAFRELVSNYVDLVYSTAMRVVGGDAHLAKDVAQTVFVHLARNAGSLSRETKLGGWLHRDTRNVAAKMLRGERRRQLREKEAAEMNTLHDHSEANLAQVRPILDEAINELGAQDRAAIILRFFEQQDFRSVGEALGSSEDAAQKRVMRALEKLHALLKHRDVALSAVGLGTALATEAVTAAPAGLATSLASAALASAAASVGLSATLFKLATMSKIQAGFLGVIVLAGATTCMVVQHQAQAALQTQDESLRRQSAELAWQQGENERLVGLARTGGSRANKLDDLVRIRHEVASLRQQTNNLAVNLEENRRLRTLAAQRPNASPSILQVKEEDKKLGIARMNYTTRWLVAFRAFADKNRDQFPTSFDEARPFLHQETTVETNLTDEQFEMLYRGPATNIATPERVLVLREKQARRNYYGQWWRAYGFADGHSEVASSPDGNYDAWEKRKIILSPRER